MAVPRVPEAILTVAENDGRMGCYIATMRGVTTIDIRFRVQNRRLEWNRISFPYSTVMRIPANRLYRGTLYEWQARAVNDDGKSGWSRVTQNSRIRTAGTANNPANPSDMALSQDRNSVLVTWSDIASVTDYYIRYRRSTAVNWRSVPLEDSKSSPFELQGIDEATTYVVEMYAISATGVSGWVTARITTDLFAPFVSSVSPFRLLERFSEPDVIPARTRDQIKDDLTLPYDPNRLVLRPRDPVVTVSDRLAGRVDEQYHTIRDYVRSALITGLDPVVIDQLAGLWNIRRNPGEANDSVLDRMRQAPARHFKALVWPGLLADAQDSYPDYRLVEDRNVLHAYGTSHDFSELSPYALDQDQLAELLVWVQTWASGPSITIPTIRSQVQAFDWRATVRGPVDDEFKADVLSAGLAWIVALPIAADRYVSDLVDVLRGVPGVASVQMTRFQLTGTPNPAIASDGVLSDPDQQLSCLRRIVPAGESGAAGGVITFEAAA